MMIRRFFLSKFEVDRYQRQQNYIFISYFVILITIILYIISIYMGITSQ